MIKLKDLKKGDTVLQVPNPLYTNMKSIYKVQVVSIGVKYITVASLFNDGTPSPRTTKFDKKTLSSQNWAGYSLFLGSEEEYQLYLEEREKSKTLYKYIKDRISPSLSYKKLAIIKEIIDADNGDVDFIYEEGSTDITLSTTS